MIGVQAAVAGTRVILVGMWLQITAAPLLQRPFERPAANRTVVLLATASASIY